VSFDSLADSARESFCGTRAGLGADFRGRRPPRFGFAVPAVFFLVEDAFALGTRRAAGADGFWTFLRRSLTRRSFFSSLSRLFSSFALFLSRFVDGIVPPPVSFESYPR
jgi:hypothetical protein